MRQAAAKKAPGHRLLLLTHSYAPENTAPARRWKAFVTLLQERGVQVTVIAPDATGRWPWGSETGAAGECILRIPGAVGTQSRAGRLVRNVLGSLATIPRALSCGPIDSVAATVPALTTAAAGKIVSWARRVPLILEMRDAWPDLAHDAGLARTPLRLVMEKVLSSVQRSAAVVITVTEGFADILRQRGAATVVCIPNGCSERRSVQPHPGVLRQGALQVVYAGNHGESQGLELLIEASAITAQRSTASGQAGVELHFYGSGTQKQQLMDYAKDLAAPVTFHPEVSGAALAEVYDKSDSCVVSLRKDWPSFQHTIPSKTYELLGLGRRLTAVVAGEAAELVRRYQPAAVVDPNPEAIAEYWLQLAAEPGLLTVPEAVAAATDFDLSASAEKILTVLTALGTMD